jgi:Fur family transcriptional regulator, iron response regulator
MSDQERITVLGEDQNIFSSPAARVGFGGGCRKVEGMAQTKRKPKSRKSELARRNAIGALLAGCPVHELRTKLRAAGLRPTRQRVALGWLLFAKGDRHLTAEKLQEEAQASRVPISLATIYNSLHQFTGAGLLREIAVDGSKTYFDTNVLRHDHFLIEGSNVLIDIPQVAVDTLHLPEPPAGTQIARVEVVVRLRSDA